MPADRNIDFNGRHGVAERTLDVTVALSADRRLVGKTGGKFRDGKRGIGDCLELLDLDGHEVSSVLRHIGIGREHRRHRFADIAHLVPGQNALPERCQLFVGSLSEVDGRQLGDVVSGPDSDDTFDPAGLGAFDRLEASVCVRRPHDAHMELVRERYITRKAAMSGHQRTILKPFDRSADPRFRL